MEKISIANPLLISLRNYKRAKKRRQERFSEKKENL